MFLDPFPFKLICVVRVVSNPIAVRWTKLMSGVPLAVTRSRRAIVEKSNPWRMHRHSTSRCGRLHITCHGQQWDLLSNDGNAVLVIVTSMNTTRTRGGSLHGLQARARAIEACFGAQDVGWLGRRSTPGIARHATHPGWRGISRRKLVNIVCGSGASNTSQRGLRGVGARDFFNILRGCRLWDGGLGLMHGEIRCHISRLFAGI